jgi:hypothetical protein
MWDEREGKRKRGGKKGKCYPALDGEEERLYKRHEGGTTVGPLFGINPAHASLDLHPAHTATSILLL